MDDSNNNKKDQNAESVVELSCLNCKHILSMQSDAVCHMWCDKKNRDFTFGGENTQPCELFEKD